MILLLLSPALAADDLEPVVATAVDGMTLDVLKTGSSGAQRLEVARFASADQTLSVRCEAFLGKSFTCEIWSVGTDEAGAPTSRFLFGSGEARPCRDGEAVQLVADKPGIGRWLVAMPPALVPAEVELPACAALRAPEAPPEKKREKRR
ncbi:MAG: hypothetical protein H6737_14280 [Alphaproteobacteria bacterium]|nr:hypothetical protein [Alphaproteobacteria bacterium]